MACIRERQIAGHPLEASTQRWTGTATPSGRTSTQRSAPHASPAPPVRRPSAHPARRSRGRRRSSSDTSVRPKSSPRAINSTTISSTIPLPRFDRAASRPARHRCGPRYERQHPDRARIVGVQAGDRFDEEAVPVLRVAEPTERHRESALLVCVSPVIGQCHQCGHLGVGDVAVAPNPHLVPSAGRGAAAWRALRISGPST